MPRIRNGIRGKLREVQLPYHQLAAQVGTTRASMRRIVYQNADPRLETAMRIAAVLQCELDELFWLASGD